jgi:hypothetical protein
MVGRLPPVIALALIGFSSPAFAGRPQPSAAALLDERAFPVAVETDELTLGRASAADTGVLVHTADGGRVFHLAGIVLPAGRTCLHPDRGTPVDCLDLTRQALSALIAGREVGCHAPPAEAGECYLAYDGAWYSINRLLVRSGMVRALAPRFIEAERRSRTEGHGLWDPVVYPNGDGWREAGWGRPAGAATKR